MGGRQRQGERGGEGDGAAAEAGQTTSSMEFLKTGSNWRLSVCLCSCGGSRRAACQCVTL